MKHVATVEWRRPAGAEFTDQRYPRAHRWRFDGGAEVPASSSPHVVPPPLSDAAAVDPEEAFVAALASCHMLWFLSIAAQRGHVVESYRDAASATVGRDDSGQLALLDVYLRPIVEFAAGSDPGAAGLAALHHAAHARCLIANSIRATVHIAGAEAGQG